MPIKDLIARGIGFNPGSVEFIVTLGMGESGAILPTTLPGIVKIIKSDSIIKVIKGVARVGKFSNR